MKVFILYNYSDKNVAGEKDPSEKFVKECAFAVKDALDDSMRKIQTNPLKDNIKSLKSLIELLSNGKFDIVFNICEGFGWDSSMEHNVAGILELLKIKFTGSGSVTLASCLDKGRTKEVLTFHGIKTPGFGVLSSPSGEISSSLKLPLIIKPLMEDASIGIGDNSVIDNRSLFKSAVSSFFKKYKKPALVEEYIDGRELNVAVLGNSQLEVLPVSEIDFSGLPKGMNKVCTYESKWYKKSVAYRKTPPVCPAEIDKKLEKKIKDVAAKAYRAMNCRDYARIDMRLSHDGTLYVIEVNPNPDLSTDAGFANIARAAGLSYKELILKILNLALIRYN